MNKVTYDNNLSYIYNAERKGAKYSINGGKSWLNHGEYAECLVKSVLGYKVCKDANTRFDKGEDIAEINASIKSWNCSLTDMKLGNDKETFLNKFWELSKPNLTYIWVYDYADKVDIWYMDETEFKAFVNAFGAWDEYSKKIRFKTCNNKINIWLENQIKGKS